jgi:L-lactate dehydrogenase complex protein LldG
MDNTTSKEKILKKVRKALTNKSTKEIGDVDNDSEIFVTSPEDLDIQFAENFSALNGKFVFCETESEFIEYLDFFTKENNWKNIFCLDSHLKKILTKGNINYFDKEESFSDADIGITTCECLIARTGSVMVSSKQMSGRRLPIYSNNHVVVAYTSQLVNNIKDSLKFIKEKYGKDLPSMITTISGPSKTADIEKTLVQGAHGPKEIIVFLIDDVLPSK